MSLLHWLQRWWTPAVPSDQLCRVHDRTEPLPSHGGPPVVDRVVVEHTPITFPAGLEPHLELRQPVVMGEREVLLADRRDVDTSSLVEAGRNTDGAAYHAQAPHPDELELDEAELEL